VFRKHSVHHVLVDVDAERLRDDVRDLSSTMAWMSASLGPSAPGFLGQRVDENSWRYLRRIKAW
jgi:hypothetical protein